MIYRFMGYSIDVSKNYAHVIEIRSVFLMIELNLRWIDIDE
jgi:hypothetical protein